MHAVFRLGLVVAKAFSPTKRGENGPGVTHRFAGGIDLKKILGRRENLGRAGKPHQRVVNVIDAVQPLAGEVLAAVGRPTFAGELIGALHGVARRCRRADAVIERHEECGLRAATAGAGHADRPRAVDLGAGKQIIDRAHAVPCRVPDNTAANQSRAVVEQRVCGRAIPARLRLLCALALRDRIVAQHNKAVLCHQRAGGLVCRVRLAIGGVAACEQYTGPGATALLRQIQQRGDMVIGQALEQHLFHTVTAAVQPPGDLGAERCFLREPAEGAPVVFPELGQVLFKGVRRLERPSQALGPLLIQLATLIDENVPENLPLVALQHAQVVRRLRLAKRLAKRQKPHASQQSKNHVRGG